jgi:hypothetical protein
MIPKSIHQIRQIMKKTLLNANPSNLKTTSKCFYFKMFNKIDNKFLI